MQGLVYVFIGLAAAGVAATAYFAFTFSPIDSFVVAIAFATVSILMVERKLRRRADARLERAIEDLSRLLSTDAKAGQVLSQRINQLADTNAGSRLDGIEGDISVLGTVVRQMAETLAELEAQQAQQAARPRATPAAATTVERPSGTAEPDPPPVEDEDTFPEPLVSPEALRQAVDDDAIAYHVAPIVELPSRQTWGFDLLPRLPLDHGGFAEAADFLPRRGHADLVQRIESRALDEAIAHARRARTAGRRLRFFVPLSRATLGDARHAGQLLVTADANRALGGTLVFAVPQVEWKALGGGEKGVLLQLAQRGFGLAMTAPASLRFDFAELENVGFKTVRIDGQRFLDDPTSYTDFHTGDVASYAGRFQMEIVASGITEEPQVLGLLEDGILLVSGSYLGRAGPMRPELLGIAPEPVVPMRRAGT